MNIIKLNLVTLLFTVSFSSLIGQTHTNYEIVEQLIEKSVQTIVEDLDLSSNYMLKFKSDDDYSILETNVLKSLQLSNVEVVTKSNSNSSINYSIDYINLNYPQIFRDGILGNYLVNRNISLKVTYFISDDSQIGKAIQHTETFGDSVLYSDINRIENLAYTFTNSELPEEPFFSSSLEPVIAIGTAAVAVYLLFNLRSK